MFPTIFPQACICVPIPLGVKLPLNCWIVSYTANFFLFTWTCEIVQKSTNLCSSFSY